VSGRSAVIVGLYVLLMMVGCGYRPEALPRGREIASETAPDGLSRAFVWIPDESSFLGATNSQPFQVWIRYLKGSQPQQVLLKAEVTDGVRLSWISQSVLEICYGSSHIYYFHNYYDYGEQHSQQLYEVEVFLKRVPKLSDCK
jgi:hypothetical protein